MSANSCHHILTIPESCPYCKIERLQARCAELEKDAARYRWLRDHVSAYGKRFAVTMNIGHDWVDIYNIDDAIDAARGEKP